MSTLENRRFFLYAIFGVILFLTYQAWQKDHPRAAAWMAQFSARDAVRKTAFIDA